MINKYDDIAALIIYPTYCYLSILHQPTLHFCHLMKIHPLLEKKINSFNDRVSNVLMTKYSLYFTYWMTKITLTYMIFLLHLTYLNQQVFKQQLLQHCHQNC